MCYDGCGPYGSSFLAPHVYINGSSSILYDSLRNTNRQVLYSTNHGLHKFATEIRAFCMQSKYMLGGRSQSSPNTNTNECRFFWRRGDNASDKPRSRCRPIWAQQSTVHPNCYHTSWLTAVILNAKWEGGNHLCSECALPGYLLLDQGGWGSPIE